MPSFDIIKQVKPNKSYRVAAVMGKFDLQDNHIVERFKGEIDLSNEWQIGAIVGRSGTGKSTIAKQLFNNSYITNFEYKADSLLDDMPKECGMEEITSAFNSVGFSSPPSWLKSYSILSNGEKMRVDLARAIISENDLIVFDEFTSVVDRNVAQLGSFAIQKAMRKTNKKFIAVSCHFDILDWLLPDWIFNTDSMSFQNMKGLKKNRPEVKFEIYSTKDKTIWQMFSKYHYLSYNHNNAAITYIALINNQIAGFLSVLHFPHSKIKNIKRVHRLVILPDYQGLGFGVRFLVEIGKIYRKLKNRFIITTSAPSLIKALKKSNEWNCIRLGRIKESNGILNGTTSKQRLTVSFEML